jgi:membrane peptidoglycan carboxypeptidase
MIKSILANTLSQISFTFVVLFLFSFTTDKTSSQDLPPISLDYASTVFTEDGKLLGYIGEKNRVEVKSTGNISKFVIWSLIATEDRNFYEHNGVSYTGLGRALLKTITGSVQGGSTITMQLARNLFLTHDRTVSRKVNEIDLALKLEEKFSKDQLLLLYLNTVYFGLGAHGIWAAAQEYFNTTPDKLTITQSATLVGLLQSPNGYNPEKNPQKLLNRRNEVLHNLVEVGRLIKGEFNKLKQQPLNLKRHFSIGKHFVEQIRRDALTIIRQKGLTLSKDQLKITSTLDYQTQLSAEEAVTKQWNSMKKEMQTAQVALISIEPGTGKIKALIGGNKDSEPRGINRAIQIVRQPGSSFKLFLYGKMLEDGYTLATPLQDFPIIVDSGTQFEWQPSNSTNTSSNTNIPLINAVQNSINLAAVYSITQLTTPDSVISFAKKLGINSILNSYPSLALGTSDVSPLEMAAASAVFAAGGIYAKPFSILKIEDKSGRIIYEGQIDTISVIDSSTAYLITTAFEKVIDEGTASSIRKSYKGFAAGKTGTTQNATDVWFVGYNKSLSTAIWAGYDNPVNKVGGGFSFGGTICVPVWTYMMSDLSKKSPNSFLDRIEKPSSIEEVDLCEESGLLATEMCRNRKKYPVSLEKMPNICPLHSSFPLEIVINSNDEEGNK